MDRAVLISVTLIATLLPLERVGAFSIAGLNVRPSQLALLAAWIFFAGAWLRGGTFAWQRGSFVALAGFFAAAGLSLMNAENLNRSLAVLAFTIFTASLALLLPNAARDEQSIKRVRLAVLFSAALVSLLGLWQFVADMLGAPAWMTGLRDTYSRSILGFTRVQATAAEPLYFANYLLLPIALAGAWLLKNPEAKTRRWLSLLLALLCVNVFLTSSRGGWLGAAITVAALLWMERSRLRDPRPILRTAGIVVLSLVVGILLLGSFFSTSRETVTDTFFRHVTTVTGGAAFDDRAQTIVAAFEVWKLHPWIGVGFGGYGPFVSTFAFSKPEAGWPIVNNETLELLSETGIVGLAAFILFLIVLFRETSGRREGETETVRIACLAALLGMLAQYQTFSTLYIMHVWFTIGLLLASSKPPRA